MVPMTLREFESLRLSPHREVYLPLFALLELRIVQLRI